MLYTHRDSDMLLKSSFHVILTLFVLFSSSNYFQTGSINPRNAIKSRWNSNSTHVCERSSSLCLLLLQQHGYWLEMGWITEPPKSSKVKLLILPLSQFRGIYVSTDEIFLLWHCLQPEQNCDFSQKKHRYHHLKLFLTLFLSNVMLVFSYS